MSVAVSRWSVPAVRLPLYAGEGAVLLQDWDVVIGGWMFTVPRGTETDGASIPRLLWRVCGHPLQAPRVYAALAHDYLYGGGGPPEVTRADADTIYRELLVSLGWGKAKAWTEYLALRMFGASHWTKRKNKE